MDDLKKLSVERLRELARKHLGKGHSRLRTRAQLLEALKGVLREPHSRLLDVAKPAVPPGNPVRVVDFPPGRRGRVRGERTAAGKRPAAPATSAPTGPAAPAPPARVTGRRAGGGSAGNSPTGARGARAALASRARAPRQASRQGEHASPGSGAIAERVEPRPVLSEAPVEEAFFETPAVPRRPRRAPALAEPLQAEPFPSPREVGTDAPVLLVRDPTTLFVFWDFRRELERGAALGLREPRLLLRIYRGEDLDRSLELPLGGRSTYVTGLASGTEYTAEVLLLGRDGWTRPVGARSGARRLPPGRVSARLEVRTLRLPWSEPLAQAPTPSRPAPARHEPLDSPRRVSLPSSPGARGPEGVPGPSGGPRSGRN